MSRNLEVGERSGPVPVIWECWPNELVSRVRVHAGVAVKWGQSGTSLLRLTHQPHLPPGNAAMTASNQPRECEIVFDLTMPELTQRQSFRERVWIRAV